MIKRVYILLVLLVGNIIYSQDNVVNEESVHVLSRVNEGKILLRWAVTKPTIWFKGNNYGYIIERYTITRDGVRLSNPEKIIVTKTPIKPEPLAQWEQVVNENDYAAVIAQAIYGESFDTDNGGDGGNNALLQIVNKSKEIDQRFSFALFAADMDFTVAKKAGLGYEDTEINKNETYLYRVRINQPEEEVKIKEGSVYVRPGEIIELPIPIDLFSVGKDKSITISWDYDLHRSFFTSYFVEKSADGTNFNRLGDVPFVNLNDKPDAPAKRMYYIDTLSQNNKTFYYRVVGITPFGEESKPSEVVSAKGYEELTLTPHIKNYELLNTGAVKLEWEFPEEGKNQINGFELNWGPTDKGPFKVVLGNISPQTRETIYKELDPSNYFSITALGHNNQKRTSLVTFVQTIDSIAPAAPIELTGEIDSLGVVSIRWKANVERDMMGYRIFRANVKNEEYSQLTEGPIKATSFADSVQLKSLNSSVYYKVVAVDKRFNMSDYSQPLIIKKPDVVPPSSPVFSNYKVNDNTVLLEWVNSSDSDLKGHKLYRQNSVDSEKGWQLVFETDTVSSFTDTKLEINRKYRYAIFAEDESGLLSDPSTPIAVNIRSKVSSEKEVIRGVNAIVDRTENTIELYWRKPSNNIVEVLIYKSKKDEMPILWKQIPANINRLVDTKIAPNNVYVYQLKAILKGGGSTPLKTKEVIY